MANSIRNQIDEEPIQCGFATSKPLFILFIIYLFTTPGTNFEIVKIWALTNLDCKAVGFFSQNQ